MNKQQSNNNNRASLPRQVRRVVQRQKPAAAAQRAVQRVLGIPSNQRMGPPPVSLIRGTAQQGRPVITSSRNNRGDLRINVRFREYVQDIAGSVGYAVSLLSINPGLASLFPWLSSIANNFESYCFNKLGMEYRTESSSSTAGKVILTVDFDASDPVPSSKQQQLQERAKADDACWQNFSLELDSADLKKLPQRYIRSVAAPANTDIKMYDVGNLLIGTQGEANANVVGELYVHYDVDLITPNPSGLLAGQSEKLVSGASAAANTIILTSAALTGSPVATVSANNTLLFSQPGQYLVELYATGTGIASVGYLLSTATYTIVDQVFLASGINGTSSVIVNVTAGGQNLVFSPTSTTLVSSTVRVAPYLYADG
jgi:hypothetical protein